MYYEESWADGMLAVWVGALLVLSGLLSLVAPRLWRRHARGTQALPTPEREASQFHESGLDPDRDWPGIVLVAMGVIRLLAGTFALLDSGSTIDAKRQSTPPSDASLPFRPAVPVDEAIL
jgi:hypothetical protein